MNFIILPGAGDFKIGPARSGRIVVVAPDTDLTVGYWDDASPAVFFPYTDGLIAAGSDGVFTVGLGTVVGVNVAAASRVGMAMMNG